MKPFVHELKCAIDAGIMAGDLMRRTREQGLNIQFKSSHADLVTQADKAVEQAVVAQLRQKFPNDDVLAEEHDWAKQGSTRLWVIDPIDGTTNYIRQYAQYSCSIALSVDGQPQLGVIFAPETNDLFYAVRGQGAYLRTAAGADQTIKASSATDIRQAAIITGFLYDGDQRLQHTLDCLASFMRLGCQGLRRFGAASIDLCYVAAGRAEAYWELALNAWDFAAGWLIAEEAGALVSDLRDRPLSIGPSSILAVCPGLKETILKVVGKNLPL